MKELSIEQKARAYDEAVNKLKIMHDDWVKTQNRAAKEVEEIFPEFAESKDDRIKRIIKQALKSYFEGNLSSGTNDVDYAACLSWLREQGEHANFRNKIQVGDKVTRNENGVLVNLSQLKRIAKPAENKGKHGMGISEATKQKLEDNLNKALEKETAESWDKFLDEQGEQKPITHKYNVGDTIYYGSFGRIVSMVVANVIDTGDGNPMYEDADGSAVFEKDLVEQKPAKNIIETWKDMRLEVYQQASGNRHEPNCSDDTTKMFSLNDIDEIVGKLGEQNPADKVEPNFCKGDWVVYCNDDVDFITGIEENGYTINEGGYIPFVCASDIRLWTVQDAKDGDVLFTSSTASHETFIFKNIDEKGNAKCYFAYDSEDGFREGKYHFIGRATDCKPATKEQRDLLFQKMKEAGYEWDADKKELRKIEQKPAWSEEDEKIINELIAVVELYYGIGDDLDKQRCLSWLNSLKDRYTWKPTKEQLTELRCVISGCSYDIEPLVELEKELKAL